MKTMMRYLIVVALAVILQACSEDKDPEIRVRNDRGTKANVQLKTSGGNTININDIASGQTTDYQSVAEGKVDASASIQNETVSPTTSFNGSKNSSYTIVVASGTTPTLRVE